MQIPAESEALFMLLSKAAQQHAQNYPVLLLLLLLILLLKIIYFISIQFGQITFVIFLSALGAITIGSGIGLLPRLSKFICSESLLILTGPRRSCVPFKIESTRWNCRNTLLDMAS
ncbi:hypothetical protein BDD12DRAFT_883416 [Trichophaea hybrida]|nr:hypothetical protein BDD12DRAFT_883416 [Trichophaea hybrida]